MAQPNLTQIVEQNNLGQVISDTSGICCKIGTCSLGEVGMMYRFKGPNVASVRTHLGYGPLAEAVASTVAQGRECWAVPCTQSTPGVAGAVSHTGTGTATMSVTGTPFDDISPIITVVAGKIRYSLDGITDSAAVLVSGSTRLYAIPGTGLTVDFGSTGTMVADDEYSFDCTAPTGSLSDVLDALDVVVDYSAKPGFVHFVGCPAYVAAHHHPSLSAVVKTGSSPDIVLSGTNVVEGETTIEITTTGGRGAGAFRYRLTHTGSWAEGITIPATPGTYALGASGVSVTFADSSHTDNDTYVFTMILTDIPSTIAAEFAGIDAALSAAFTASYKPMFALIELPDEVEATLISEVSTLSSEQGRIMLSARYCSHASALPIQGGAVYRRPQAWKIADRISSCKIHEDLGKVKSGPLSGIAALEVDESLSPGIGAARIECLRTIVGQPGFFVNSDTDGNMASAPGSDFAFVQHRRVMDRFCVLARERGTVYLNDDIFDDPTTGAIKASEAALIERAIYRYCASGLGDSVSAIAVVIDRDEVILETKNISLALSLTPKGYAKTITMILGLRNPALEA
jgi:hypothetical protein